MTHLHILLVRDQDIFPPLLEDFAYRLQSDIALRDIDELTRFKRKASRFRDAFSGI